MSADLKWKDDHFIITYSGILNINETIAVYDQISISNEYDTCKFGIVDCTYLLHADYDPSTYDIHAAYSKVVASHIRRDHFRVGVVVANEEIEENVYSLIKATEKFLHAWDRKVFWSYEEAMAWAEENKDL